MNKQLNLVEDRSISLFSLWKNQETGKVYEVEGFDGSERTKEILGDRVVALRGNNGKIIIRGLEEFLGLMDPEDLTSYRFLRLPPQK